MQTAHNTWGENPPDWVVALAQECDRTSQREVAGTIGYSTAVVSLVLNRRYPGDLGAVKQAASGALLNVTVTCPMYGELEGHICLEWQRKGKTFSAISLWHVRMYHACRKCPNRRDSL